MAEPRTCARLLSVDHVSMLMAGLGCSGTLIIRGFGFTTLQTTLMQVRLLGLPFLSCPFERPVCKIPYGSFIAIVYVNANSLPVCSIKFLHSQNFHIYIREPQTAQEHAHDPHVRCDLANNSWLCPCGVATDTHESRALDRLLCVHLAGVDGLTAVGGVLSPL